MTTALEVSDGNNHNQQKVKWKEISKESCPINSYSWCSCNCCGWFMFSFLFIWVIIGVIGKISGIQYWNDGAYVTFPCDEYDNCCAVTYESYEGEQTTDTFLKNMSCEGYKDSFMIPLTIFYFLWLVIVILTIIGFIKLIPQCIFLSIIQGCISCIIGIYGVIFCIIFSTSRTDTGTSILHIVIGSISGWVSYKIWTLMLKVKNMN
mmetsp:Transcript_11129/g.10002  ORF Transcript_11129/g.10002 Transcript_11129/m.10002 type:complete len:206 (-) Transcript_11129:88-705(-)